MILLRPKRIWFNPRIRGTAVWPFIAIAKHVPDVHLPRIINHEKIHHRQQLEMLYIPFFIWYFLSLLLPNGYREMSLEQEAFDNDDNLDYLKTRKPYAWVKYLKK